MYHTENNIAEHSIDGGRGGGPRMALLRTQSLEIRSPRPVPHPTGTS